MEGEMASLWNHQESVEILKNEILCTTYELESTRTEASEEIRKNKETVNHLLQLLKSAYQERDEARDQIQVILSRVIPRTPPQPFNTHLEPEPPTLIPSKPNSSMTGSNSFSDRHSYGGSELEHGYNVSLSSDMLQREMGRTDRVIERLTRGKELPQKGKLLEAVMNAGPLLQTLIVAGPLPRWRNPPTDQMLASLASPSEMLDHSMFDSARGIPGSGLTGFPYF